MWRKLNPCSWTRTYRAMVWSGHLQTEHLCSCARIHRWPGEIGGGKRGGVCDFDNYLGRWLLYARSCSCFRALKHRKKARVSQARLSHGAQNWRQPRRSKHLLEVGSRNRRVHGVQQGRPAYIVLEGFLGGHQPAREQPLRVEVALHRRVLGLVAPVPDLRSEVQRGEEGRETGDKNFAWGWTLSTHVVQRPWRGAGGKGSTAENGGQLLEKSPCSRNNPPTFTWCTCTSSPRSTSHHPWGSCCVQLHLR